MVTTTGWHKSFPVGALVTPDWNRTGYHGKVHKTRAAYVGANNITMTTCGYDTKIWWREVDPEELYRELMLCQKCFPLGRLSVPPRPPMTSQPQLPFLPARPDRRSS